jgi:hypothetical protein
MSFTFRSLFAALAIASGASGASAGWDNVFQLTCNNERRSYYTRDCCPQPERRVEYVQRSYYTPVTEWKRETYRVPVRETVKSYYWEPVKSYTYKSYYDPCSGTCQEIAEPRTSYVLKEQCNSVERFVEKTRLVPVRSYREVTETTPVVTYYYPPTVRQSYYTVPAPPIGAPRLDEFRSVPNGASPETISPQNLPTTPGGTSLPRPMPPAKPSAARTAPATAHTASFARIRGEVVANDQLTPKAGSRLVFVNATDHDDRKYATANGYGEFDLKLPAGEWYLYVDRGDGQAVRYKKLTIAPNDEREFKLVSR